MSINPKIQSRKLPPYGKTTVPKNNAIRVLYGWPQAGYEAEQTIVLPVGKDPEQYHWPVKNLDVTCFARAYTGPKIPTDIVLSILEALVRDGAKSLVIFGTEIKPDGRIAGDHHWPGDLIKWAEVHDAT